MRCHLRPPILGLALLALAAFGCGDPPPVTVDGGSDPDPIDAPTSCNGVTCSGHGTCDDSSGVATCVCEAGYVAFELTCLAPPTGPLDGLPSAPGPHVAQIQALADDTWLSLGQPAADPRFGRARGRSWGGRAFALAPELRGAFFTGEGLHAYVKPDDHGMDDVYFFDVNRNRWIAVYPGMHVGSFNQRVADGQLRIGNHGHIVDEFSNPVPVHPLIHAWGFLTYDPMARKFAFLAGDGLGRYFLPGGDRMETGLQRLEAQRAGVTVRSMSPWFYDVVAARFERTPMAAPAPDLVQRANTTFGAFQYVPSRRQFLYASAYGVAAFDPATSAWSVDADQGPRPPGYDHGGTYDTRRDRLYMMDADGGRALHVYDVATATWSIPATTGTAPRGSRTNDASIFYDTANDAVVVFHYLDRTLYALDLATRTWTSRPLPASVLSSVSYPSFSAFYDPTLNAYFCFAAGDSEDNGVMWAYRYKRGS